ncbi:MAG: tetratricopeptide repeat protein [Capsulimonadaceae bacterium]
MRWLIIAAAAIAGGVASWILVGPEPIHKRLLGAGIGVLVGGGVLFFVSGARVLLYTYINRRKLGKLQGRIRRALTEAQEKYEQELEEHQEPRRVRLHFAIAHLLQDEIDKSIQEFQQAHKLGACESNLFNNAGVALARRGKLTQSVEMLQKAISHNGHKGQPHINLAHVYQYAVADEEDLLIERALAEVDTSIETDGELPVHLHRRGLILLRANEIDEAVALFRRAMELASTGKTTFAGGDQTRLLQADSHTNIGLAMHAKTDIRAAVMHFQLALRADNGHGRALSDLGVMFLLQGDDAEALLTLQKAVHVDPKSAPVRNNLGYALCRAHSINDGIREFREAILLNPSLYEPYYNLGKVYLDANLLEPAEKNLTRAYQINPRSWEILVALAVVRIRQENWQQAVELLQHADKMGPNQPLILNSLATCHAIDGDYVMAQEVLQRAVAIDEGNDEIHAQLGWVYLLQDNVAMCANEMAVAIRHNSEVAEYHNNSGLCHIGRGAFDPAISSFRRALSIDPECIKPHYHLGYVYALQGKRDLAIKEWEVSVKIEDKFVDVHVNLGVAYFQKGQYELAVHEFKKVIAARQEQMDDFSNLGLALAKHGMEIRKASNARGDAKYKESVDRHRLAIDMFNRAISLEPNNVMLHSNRGLACYFANQAEEAVQEWAAVTRIDPSYARRRQKVMQSEFDETAVKFTELNIMDRADRVPPRTADLLYRLAPGYETEEWQFVIDDEGLVDVPEWERRSRHIERVLKALAVE